MALITSGCVPLQVGEAEGIIRELVETEVQLQSTQQTWTVLAHDGPNHLRSVTSSGCSGWPRSSTTRWWRSPSCRSPRSGPSSGRSMVREPHCAPLRPPFVPAVPPEVPWPIHAIGES